MKKLFASQLRYPVLKGLRVDSLSMSSETPVQIPGTRAPRYSVLNRRRHMPGSTAVVTRQNDENDSAKWRKKKKLRERDDRINLY